MRFADRSCTDFRDASVWRGDAAPDRRSWGCFARASVQDRPAKRNHAACMVQNPRAKRIQTQRSPVLSPEALSPSTSIAPRRLGSMSMGDRAKGEVPRKLSIPRRRLRLRVGVQPLRSGSELSRGLPSEPLTADAGTSSVRPTPTARGSPGSWRGLCWIHRKLAAAIAFDRCAWRASNDRLVGETRRGIACVSRTDPAPDRRSWRCFARALVQDRPAKRNHAACVVQDWRAKRTKRRGLDRPRSRDGDPRPTGLRDRGGGGRGRTGRGGRGG